jgi:hypothetical protein
MPIDIISPLNDLLASAAKIENPTPYAQGYQDALKAAVSLATILQQRIDFQLATECFDRKFEKLFATNETK